MSWQASHIPALDWLPLLMNVAKCSLLTQQPLHSIGMAKLFLKVGARPPAPNFGTGLSSHKYHRRPTCPKHNSSLGLARMAPTCLDVHSVLYSGSCRASFSGIRFFPRNPLNSAEHTSVLNHSRARLICSGIRRNPEFRPEFRREGPLTWYSVPRVTNIH